MYLGRVSFPLIGPSLDGSEENDPWWQKIQHHGVFTRYYQRDFRMRHWNAKACLGLEEIWI